jgi:hypothetical protein
VFLPGPRGSADTEKAGADASAFFFALAWRMEIPGAHAGLSK